MINTLNKVVDIIAICLVLITTSLDKAIDKILLIFFTVVQIILIVIINRQPQTNKKLSFKVRFNLILGYFKLYKYCLFIDTIVTNVTFT